MSNWCGKCDLFDHMCGQGGWFDKDGKPVKMGDEGVYGFYSDEFKDFEAFKKKTNGTLYQHHKVIVDNWNLDFVKEHCKEFDYKESVNEKGKKVYTYFYWDKEYKTLRELNKKVVYVEMPIHFNTILDLIPYYPYLIAFSCGDHIVISNESYVEILHKEFIESGFEDSMYEIYKKELANHYLEICEVLLKDKDKRTHIESIEIPEIECDSDKEYYDCALTYNIDYNFPIEYVWSDGLGHTHWTSPKYCQGNIIKIHKEDIEHYLADDIKNDTVKIKYVGRD